ncbi:hypothetical protein AgCh_002529 [Apium graveolens]
MSRTIYAQFPSVGNEVHSDSGSSSRLAREEEEFVGLKIEICSRLIDNHNRLNLWTGDDCCSWLGIKCNNHGHVTELDLEYSTLTGLIPSNIGNLTFLTYLDFMGNYIQGLIPDTIGGNHITGNLPPCLNNLTAMTTSEMVEDYLFLDMSESLIDNAKGYELEYTLTNIFLFSIDLSNNNISVEIPEELMDLRNLLNLNLAGNNLAGRIPDRIGQMEQLEYLDLSRNKLHGPIPQTVSELEFLIHLNLSFNDLSGRIPTGNPLQVLENLSSIYVGNNQLCGRPTLKLCAGDPEPHEGPDNKKTGSDYDSDSAIQDFRQALALEEEEFADFASFIEL